MTFVRFPMENIQGMILDKQQRNVSVQTLIAEAVDNALDAKATEVMVSVRTPNSPGRGELRVQDNGPGIPGGVQQLMKMYASTKPGAGETSGRYGIGVKDLVYGVGGQSGHFTAVSLCAGGFVWKVDQRLGEMREEGMDERHDKEFAEHVIGETGTSIRLRDCYRGLTKPKTLAAFLKQEFQPWIEGGGRLLVNNEKVWPIEFPEHDGQINEQIEFGDKIAIVEAGMLSECEQRPVQGCWMRHLNRMIEKGGAFGYGDFGIRGTLVTIRLIGPWGLSSNKDRLAERDIEELEPEVEDLLRPFLETAAKRAEKIEADEVTDYVNDALQKASIEIVGVEDPEGEATPLGGEGGGGGGGGGDRTTDGPPRRKRRIRPAHTGKRKGRLPKGGWKMQWVPGEAVDSTHHVDARKRVVFMHENNIQAQSIRTMGREAVLLTVAGIISHHEVSGDLPFVDAHGMWMGAVLRQIAGR